MLLMPTYGSTPSWRRSPARSNASYLTPCIMHSNAQSSRHLNPIRCMYSSLLQQNTA
jgi:hypothetical protein